MMIFKILRADEWAALQRDGETPGAPVDVRDGFVHFSTAAQLPETARRHFADENGLHLLAVDETAVADALKWEPSRGGDLFPHLFAPLRLSDIAWSRPLPLGAGGHEFGDLG